MTIPEAKPAPEPPLPSSAAAPKVAAAAAPRQFERQVLAVAAARSRHLTHRHRRRPRRPRSRAHGNGVIESELTLDVAQRLQRSSSRRSPAWTSFMTRDTDVFIPRGAHRDCQREAADLFLSIHANASRNAQARGIETYFLRLRDEPERRPSRPARTPPPRRSGTTCLNREGDSPQQQDQRARDLAATVQKSMAKRPHPKKRALRDLGVQAGAVRRLIGAAMPSVLAEVSFLTTAGRRAPEDRRLSPADRAGAGSTPSSTIRADEAQ